MYFIYCKECSQIIAGKSGFAVSTSEFRLETLKKHILSKKHILYRDRCVDGGAAPLTAAFQRLAAANQTSEESEMTIKFNTAYNILKEELPFTKFKVLMVLMKKNRLNVNPNYANDTASTAQFIGVIADSLKKKKTSLKIVDSMYISFMIDGDIFTKE